MMIRFSVVKPLRPGTPKQEVIDQPVLLATSCESTAFVWFSLGYTVVDALSEHPLGIASLSSFTTYLSRTSFDL